MPERKYDNPYKVGGLNHLQRSQVNFYRNLLVDVLNGETSYREALDELHSYESDSVSY